MPNSQFSSSAFNEFVISARSLPSRNTLVSSANKIANNFPQTFGRSFIQSKKKRGPKIDPCHTPQVIVFCVELLLFKFFILEYNLKIIHYNMLIKLYAKYILKS